MDAADIESLVRVFIRAMRDLNITVTDEEIAAERQRLQEIHSNG
jgi:hypothetical protein